MANQTSSTVPILTGRNFVAVVRLSTGSNQTLALPGETCERVPAAKGGSVADALAFLEACGYVRRVQPPAAPVVRPAGATPVADAAPAAPAAEGE